MKIKNVMLIMALTQLTACTHSKDLVTDNTLFKTTAVKSDNQSDRLYTQYLDAKKNIKPQKKFSRPSSEAAPKPDEGPTTPDTTPYLNLRANTRLKQEYMGDRPFPVRAGKIKAGEDSNFSVKSCCNTGPLNWGAWIKPIPFPVVNLWGVYAGHRIDTTLNLPNNELLYSPTTAPPNQANLEVTTVYDRWQGGYGGTIKRYVGIWNHKLAKFESPKQMDDPIFLSNYVGNFPDGNFYFLKNNENKHNNRII